jgi:hypothetical protein
VCGARTGARSIGPCGLTPVARWDGPSDGTVLYHPSDK